MRPRIAGIVLAGGLSRRMGGGDKALKLIGGRTILDRVIARAAPQVDPLALNANGDPARFAATGLPMVPDSVEGFPGPLAGVLAGLEWARDQGSSHVASFACDAPFLPADLVARLWRAVEENGAEIASARSDGREHPVFALWPVALADALRAAVVGEGVRKVDVWTARYRLAHAEFSTAPVDPFFNVNRPEDIEAAEAALSRRPGR
ncbi:MAG: molybdenum cofactor guanylyltransferase MobA [Defluviicoccus sp.]|nr:molybdenum cofactor guanylyltransferase MobA [Defluviicoccus sp.]MDE0385199.1 molybdenum cofactor guanylyltransferase MobA [Defluviicoccus sp.]